MNPVIAVVVVLVVFAVLVVLARRRRANDGVDSFHRQIDALSPEARRPTVDQVKRTAERRRRRGDDEPGGARGT